MGATNQYRHNMAMRVIGDAIPAIGCWVIHTLGIPCLVILLLDDRIDVFLCFYSVAA